MRFKHSLPIFGLVAMLGLGIGVGLAKENAHPEEVKAVNNTRVNFIIKETSSLYDNAKPELKLVYSAASDANPTALVMDEDLEHDSDGYAFMEFGTGDWYAVLTTIIDLDDVHAGGYDNVGFRRYNPSTHELWSTWWVNTNGSKIAPANFLKDNNTFVVKADNTYATDWGNYWKLTAYSGKTSYDSTADANKNYYLKSSGYAIDLGNPGDAPHGYEFAGWYKEKTFTNAWTSSDRLSADTALYAKYVPVTVNFTNESDEVYADTLELNLGYDEVRDNWQYEGLITVANVANKFRIRRTVDGGEPTYVNALQDGVTAAAVSGDYIQVNATGTYSVYYKISGTDEGKIWIQAASASDESTMYAKYFLSVVVCNYPNEPSGWNLAETRYGTLTGDAKDYMYDVDISELASNHPVRMAIERYNLACQNHALLSRFIKDSTGTETRVIPSLRTSFDISTIISNNGNTLTIVIVASSIAVLALVGGYFYFRKRKEDR